MKKVKPVKKIFCFWVGLGSFVLLCCVSFLFILLFKFIYFISYFYVIFMLFYFLL